MSDPEVTDNVWYALIDLALLHRSRIGSRHNITWERRSYFIVTMIPHLAGDLVQRGVIEQWPAGFRRLGTIEQGAAREFRIHWKKHPNDP